MPASAAASEGAIPGPGGGQARVAGHFGELLQGRLHGEVVLITLPCPALAVRADWRPGGGDLRVEQPPGLVPGPALRRLFALAGRAGGGRLRLQADMPPGAGAGASTAALLAVAQALGLPAGPEAAELCRQLEGASDPLMLPEPGQVLWASRRGRVVADLPPVPAFEVVGGFHGPPVPTDPEDAAFAEIADLLGDWRAARGDRARLAAIATESARRNHALHGGPDPAPLLRAARKHGALGVVAAHTGSARGLLFAPGGAPAAAVEALRAAGLAGVVRFTSPGAM
ncbi:propanediol utilization protein [Rhodobacteraceae bacterium 2CG4]|uniref:Propanediol utilization protein n=1 Tax=Halovulum marinum TaxID=2662447 RepID=A0A6L5Z314_9RHOB|nr:propanediol utilization protein [Halovulum marinum]MSU90465.1 propanediol utilization protein [Halovulum marinum]